MCMIGWCEVVQQLAYIATKNVWENNLDFRMKYIKVRLKKWDKTLVQEGWQDTK